MRRVVTYFLGPLGFCLAAAVVIIWQMGIARGAPVRLEDSEKMDAAQGACRDEGRKFFYFYYYLGLLPVTTTLHVDQFSVGAAQELVAQHGDTLSNDVNSACAVGRLGDWGRFFLYLPNAWLIQSARQPSLIIATSVMFIAGLLATLAATFARGRWFLGIALVALIGSYKVQLFWSYFADNIQGLLISTTLLLLALNFRFVSQSRVTPLGRDWVIAILSAVVLGCVRTARGDSLPLAASVVLIYFLSGQRWYRRLALSAVFVCALSLIGRSFDAYFAHKSRQSQAFITSVGGKIYAGGPELHHSFWHPFAAGLGDYGTDRGFAWDDGVTYSLALPQVNHRMGRNFLLDHYFFLEPSLPPEQWLKPETVPVYDEILRTIVLDTIRENPMWYLNILYRRGAALLGSANRIRIGWESSEVFVPFSPWFIPVAIALSVILRRFEYLKLLLFISPTAFIPIFIYGGGGTVLLSIIHLVVVAILVELTVGSVLQGAKKIGFLRFRTTLHGSDCAIT